METKLRMWPIIIKHKTGKISHICEKNKVGDNACLVTNCNRVIHDFVVDFAVKFDGDTMRLCPACGTEDDFDMAQRKRRKLMSKHLDDIVEERDRLIESLVAKRST